MRASRKRYSLQNGSILSRKLIFDDNAIAMRLFGSHHLHLAIVEKELEGRTDLKQEEYDKLEYFDLVKN